jgi:hypothetical protein
MIAETLYADGLRRRFSASGTTWDQLDARIQAMGLLRKWLEALFGLPGKYRIFISYSREHADQARGLQTLLLVQHPVFLDSINLRAGEDWQEQLRDAIAKSTHIYVLWCHHASQSQYVNDEIDTAIKLGKCIVPIRISNFPFSQKLAKYHGVTISFDMICSAGELSDSEMRYLARAAEMPLSEQWHKESSRAHRNRLVAATILLFLIVQPFIALAPSLTRPRPAELAELHRINTEYASAVEQIARRSQEVIDVESRISFLLAQDIKSIESPQNEIARMRAAVTSVADSCASSSSLITSLDKNIEWNKRVGKEIVFWNYEQKRRYSDQASALARVRAETASNCDALFVTIRQLEIEEQDFKAAMMLHEYDEAILRLKNVIAQIDSVRGSINSIQAAAENAE